MRAYGFVPCLYLFTVGKSLSFPGIRHYSSVSTEPALPEVSTSFPAEASKVVYVKKLLGNESKENVSKTDAIDSQDKQILRNKEEQRKVTFAVYLAALSGCLDIICFQRFGCFAHLMTGNTVKCLAAVTEMKWKEASFLATMVAFYTAGAAGYRLVDIWNTNTADQTAVATKNKSTFSHLATILLPVFAIVDVLHRLSNVPAAVVAFVWAFGSGMVNASTMNTMGIVTNAVTGHWNKFGTAMMDLMVLGERKAATKTTYKVLLSTALSVCVTSLLAQIVSTRTRLVSFLPPIGVLIGLLYFVLFRWYGNPVKAD